MAQQTVTVTKGNRTKSIKKSELSLYITAGWKEAKAGTAAKTGAASANTTAAKTGSTIGIRR